MNCRMTFSRKAVLIAAVFGSALLGVVQRPSAQNFDYGRLYPQLTKYTVIVDMKIEISFGVHSNEEQDRYLGTIVSEDGLVIFNAAVLSNDQAFSSFAGFSVRTTPKEIEVTTLDGEKFNAEYVGVDRVTRIGFLKLTGIGDRKFSKIAFKDLLDFKIGDWLTLYMLLPDFVTPPLAADIGMVSANLKSPEQFPLTVGFNALQLTSVLYDEKLEPVGVLGLLNDPSMEEMEAAGGMEGMDQFSLPMLGVVTAQRLSKLIASPPEKGKTDRGWLGITLQALTEEMNQFWSLNLKGGIIVNDIVKNSPAYAAGIQVGDLIYEINGQPVDVNREEKIPVFQRLISEMGPGAAVEFSILRNISGSSTDTLKLLATLQTAPMGALDAPEYENKALEFKVRDMVFADYLYYNLDSEIFKGIVVSELIQGGLADVEGLMLGDIIQRISGEQVTAIGDVQQVLERLEKEKPKEIVFFVWRDKKTMFVNVKTDWED